MGSIFRMHIYKFEKRELLEGSKGEIMENYKFVEENSPVSSIICVLYPSMIKALKPYQLIYELLLHPLYSPNLTLRDYSLSSCLKRMHAKYDTFMKT